MGAGFFSSDHDLTVFKNVDGSYSWSGNYNGVAIKQVFPNDDGQRCILFLDPDANLRSVFENLLCIDRNGNSVWAAKLPGNPDVFLEVIPTSDGLLTNTWSGWQILLDW